MAVSVGNKIRGGTAFLFLLTVLSGGVGLYYFLKLRGQSREVVKANYESLEYVHGMQAGLDSVLAGRKVFLDSFSRQLQHQAANITERGERESTDALQNAFMRFRIGDTSALADVRRSLSQILLINMNAIRDKSSMAEDEAREGVTILITALGLILVVAFIFVVNFPSWLTEPIGKLTEAIKQIAARNYHHRIHLNSGDEFGRLAEAFNSMAERLEYFESSNLARLMFERDRAEAVIRSLKDASIGIDHKGKILFANDQALQVLGLTSKELLGKDVLEVSSRNDLLKYLLEERSNLPFKVVLEGRENYFIKEQMELDNEDGKSRVIVLKNITSFKELDAAKTNFIATISHELKTPLAASDFSLKLLEDKRTGSLSDGQLELVENLKADNQRMLRILSELLNLAQVETGRMQLDIKDVSARDIVKASVSAVAVAASSKSIRVDVKTQDVLVRADADKAGWVLNNFLTNAVRYAPAETVVDLTLVVRETKVEFLVHDQGPGIPEEYLTRLFDRYFQVPGRSDKNGSGIGLAISKEMIEAMGGEIWVESKPGEGSLFGFALPRA